ncbi:hypothetical protein, partial [Halobacillus trueperi]|uniref:hypothetical protein n=1 Tax=Halobacillus trueperi TaxID=156205 RepID=UPI001C6EF067
LVCIFYAKFSNTPTNIVEPLSSTLCSELNKGYKKAALMRKAKRGFFADGLFAYASCATG